MLSDCLYGNELLIYSFREWRYYAFLLSNIYCISYPVRKQGPHYLQIQAVGSNYQIFDFP